eukprot:GSA120T00024063001.1
MLTASGTTAPVVEEQALVAEDSTDAAVLAGEKKEQGNHTDSACPVDEKSARPNVDERARDERLTHTTSLQCGNLAVHDEKSSNAPDEQIVGTASGPAAVPQLLEEPQASSARDAIDFALFVSATQQSEGAFPTSSQQTISNASPDHPSQPQASHTLTSSPSRNKLSPAVKRNRDASVKKRGC